MEQVLNTFKDFRGLDNRLRQAAEEQLRSYHKQPGINLKLVCKTHWSKIDDKFEEPEVSAAEKEALKQHLPVALSDPSNHIRTTAGSIIATIAAWDWPEKWPGLVENLALCLQSEDLNLVHGAMKTLDMFASGKNLTDVHIPLLVDVVFPQLQRIFGEYNYPERIRMRAVRILFSIVDWLGMVKAVYEKSTANILKPALPTWYQLFQAELSKPDQYGVGHGSKIGALQVLFKLVVDFPEYIKNSLPSLLEPLWNSLTSSVDIWERVAIFGTEKDMSGYDSDAGDEIGFKNYLCMLVEVFTCIEERKRLQPLLSHGLIELAYVVTRLTQLTEGQSELYDIDPSAYITEEDEEDPSSFSIRCQAGKLIGEIARSLDGHGIEAFQAATARHIEELESMQVSHEDPVWWKRREALLFSIGNALRAWSESVEGFENSANLEDVPFDVAGIMKIILSDCESPVMILRGRALWCASIAVKFLPENAAALREEELPEHTNPQIKFLIDVATNAMQTPDAPLPYQLYAAACVTELAKLLDPNTLRECVGTLLPCLATLAPDLEESSLFTLLATMEGWIELDQEATVQHSPVIIDNIMEAWSRNSSDPHIQGLIIGCVSSLCKIPAVLPIAQERIGNILQQIFADLASRDNGLIEAATDVLGHLIMDASFPLPPILSNNLIPSLLSIMLYTHDNAMLQSGCTTLVALVRCGKEHLANWEIDIVLPGANGPESRKGTCLDFVVHIVERILTDPELDDHAAICLGPLISKLIDNVGSLLGDRSAAILQSVVLRMEKAELSTLNQEFLMVFALLIRQNLNLVLEFLCGFQMPSGESALSFVLSLWTKTFEDRHGAYQMKVSILALSSLFSQPGLEGVMVPADAAIEDEIIETTEQVVGRVTRSKAKQKPPQNVPRFEELNVRIFKLMLREHMWLLEEQNAPANMSSEEDWGEIEQDGGDYESPYALASEYGLDDDDFKGAIPLDRMLASQYQVDDEETDPDILNDPAYSMDPEQFIYDWMKNLATENVELFDHCVNQLSQIERHHLIQNLIQSRP